MSLYKWLEESTPAIARALEDAQRDLENIAPGRDFIMSEHAMVSNLLDGLIAVVLPGYRGYAHAGDARHEFSDAMSAVAPVLQEWVRKAFEYRHHTAGATGEPNYDAEAIETVKYVFSTMPNVKRDLNEDIQAAYEGDPSAKSTMEIIISYPGLLAIVTYRIAHLLYEKVVPLIPRMMTELAHSRTGIDIHPGATIGPGFFIDHGTGVVIGETTVIGRHVKLYQGVTLGALSFPKDAEGRIVKGVKRHPNVEDNVTIYAGATILGGETTIGAGSEVGGNVWLTHSIPENSKVYNQQPDPRITSPDS